MQQLPKQVLKNGLLFGLFLCVYLIFAFYFGARHYPSFFHVSNYIEYLHLSAPKIVTLVGGSDIGSYTSSALSFLTTGHFLGWTLNLWPPGQVFVLSLLFKITGTADVFLKMLVLTAILWAAGLVLVYHSLVRVKQPLLKFLLALMPLYLTVFQGMIFGYMLGLSDNLALPLFLISISFLVLWVQNNKFRYLLFSAIFFGLSAYFRAYFELFVNFLTLILAIVFLAFLIINFFNSFNFLRRARGKLSLSINHIFNSKVKSVFVALIIFNLILLPWRLYHGFQWVGGVFAWSQLWDFPSYWGFAGANIACQANLTICETLANMHVSFPSYFYRAISLGVYLTKPISWYVLKAKFFNVFWFGDSVNIMGISWSSLIKPDHLLLFIEGWLILGAGLVSTFLLLIFKRLRLLGFFALIFLIFNIALFSFFHYEVRYSLSLQLFFVYLPVWWFFGVGREAKSKSLEEGTDGTDTQKAK